MSRILVVEDDEVLRNELIELLRNEGYEAEYISTDYKIKARSCASGY